MGGGGGRWALQQSGRLEGPLGTVVWFVPSTEHLKKDIMGAETHPLHPGFGLQALLTQSRHLFLIPTKALYGPLVAPRPGNVIDVGLSLSSSTS